MYRSTILGLAFVFFLSCSNEESNGDWSIPVSQVFDGGPGKDGIPSIDDPQFSPASETNYLSDNDLVIGVKIGNDIKAYPHPIMDWHEIVNDEVGGQPVAITYCPLTGTTIGWDRQIQGVTTTFGVSGLLFNTNLIPYDRATDSNWSQMLQESVNGELQGQRPAFVQTMETTWSTWKSMYPDALVQNRNTGFSRSYGDYPYGSYRTESNLLFPVENNDSRLFAKERVLGVDLPEAKKAYRFTSFSERGVIRDVVGTKPIIVVGDASSNFMVAFEDNFRDDQLPLQAVLDQGEVIFTDALDNSFNIFGEVVEGPDTGARLTAINAYIGYWVAWAAFYPTIAIYGEDD